MFLHQRGVRGEGFGSKYTPYFTWEMAKEFNHCSAGIICLFFIVFCSIAGLQHSIVKLKIVDTVPFLITSCQKVERGSQQTPYYKILFEAVFGKALHAQTHKSFEGVKHSILFL